MKTPSFSYFVASKKEHPDSSLIELLGTDSSQAIELMFKKYYAFLCLAIRRIISDEHVVEDLAQDVFMDVWRKRDALKITTSLPAYLRRAGVNKSLNYIRDQKIKWDDEDQLPLLASAQVDANKILEGEEMQQLVDRLIDSLPERCRLVFSLSRFEEMSYREIAEHLNISVKTVENQISKALKILREGLEPILKEEK